jgi:hypothetical protein
LELAKRWFSAPSLTGRDGALESFYRAFAAAQAARLAAAFRPRPSIDDNLPDALRIGNPQVQASDPFALLANRQPRQIAG